MNRSIAWAMALLMVGFVPSSQAQEEPTVGEYFRLGEDAEGDNFMTAAGEGGQESPLDPVDLLSLDVKETSDDMWFSWQVAGLDHQESVWTPNGNEILDASWYYYELTFEAMEKTFEVNVNYYVDQENRDTYAYLYSVYRTETTYTYSYEGELFATVDEAKSSIVVQVPRELLLDPNGRDPGLGDTLENFFLRANGRSQTQAFTFGLSDTYDWLPDTGTLDTTWTILDGLVSSGHLQAYSERPVRVSNGEATTFLYEVEVTNTADFIDYAIPSWEGGQEGWIVTFPDGKVRLAPDETKVIPFLVTVPFAHQHGSYHPFTVTFQSQADPLAAGLLELGVRYTAIPQPAGHHPTVYMHQLQNDFFFNTVDDDNFPEAATEQEVGDQNTADSYTCGNPSNSQGKAHTIPLSPRLEMGLDFDMNALGEAEIWSSSEQGTNGVWYNGWIVVDTKRPSTCDHWNGRPNNAVAIIESTEPVNIPAGSTVASKSVITPLERGNYIPYEDGLQMWFVIIQNRDELAPNDVICCLANDFEAVLIPETNLFLPLEEYHDDVDDLFNLLTGIDLYATTPQERMVNPGETVLFRMTAQNIGLEESEFIPSLVGANSDWAHLLGDIKKVKLEPGESQELVVAVTAASGSVDEEVADVTLILSNKEDESVRSLIRLLAVVDTDADHDDEGVEAGMLDGELQQAPTPFLLAPLALVGLAALRRRN